jgi:hypothetical protein
MKKHLLVAVSILGMGISAQAVLVNGQFNFGNTVSLTLAGNFANDVGPGPVFPAGGLSLGNADRVTTPFGNNFSTSLGDGDFTPLNPSTPGHLNGFRWNAQTLPLNGLLTFGGFTFNLVKWDEIDQFQLGTASGTNAVSFLGRGTLKGNGFNETVAELSFSFNRSGGNVNYSGTLFATGVPEGGTTVALLGIALVGIALVPRRKIA